MQRQPHPFTQVLNYLCEGLGTHNRDEVLPKGLSVLERKRSQKLGERSRALKARPAQGAQWSPGLPSGGWGGTGGDSAMESPLGIYVRSHVGCTSASHTARGPQPHRETALQGGQGPGLATTVQPLTSCVAPGRPRDPRNFPPLPLSLTEVTGGWRGPGEQRAALDVARMKGGFCVPVLVQESPLNPVLGDSGPAGTQRTQHWSR